MRVLTDRRHYESIADAIRERRGTGGTLRPGEMAGAIRELPAGDGIPLIGRFGRELQRLPWQAAEGEAFAPWEAEEPGLRFSCWTRTPGDLREGGTAPVGAVYVPLDGWTHLFVRTRAVGRVEVRLRLGPCARVQVQWGDGTGTTREAGEAGGLEVLEHGYLGEEPLREICLRAQGSLALGGGTQDSAAVAPGALLEAAWVAEGTGLSDYALAGAAGLLEVLLPPGAALGRYALSQCTALRAVTLPPGLLGEEGQEGRLPEGLLSGCRALREVCLPAGILEAGSFAFSGCARLPRLHLPRAQRLEAYVCYGDGALEEVVTGPALTELGQSAFAMCAALESLHSPTGARVKGTLELPGGLETLSSGAFSDCPGLREAVLPEGIRVLSGGALQDDLGLQRLSLPDSLTEMGTGCLSGCCSLQELVVPEGVGRIGLGALRGCTLLRKLVLLPRTPPRLSGSSALQGLDGECRIIVPAGCLEEYAGAQYWSALAEQMEEASS